MKENDIKLDSRYNIKNYLEYIKDKEYYLRSEIEGIRYGYNEDGSYYFVDPAGGPFISVGDKINSMTVASIDFETGKGFKINFE